MTTLATAAEAHQDRLLARADRSADAAERVVRKVWRRLLDVIKAGGSHFEVHAAALAALRSLPTVANNVLDDLAGTARDAAEWSAEAIVRRLTAAQREHILRTRPAQPRQPLLEDDRFREIEKLVLPPLPLDRIHAVVYQAGWVERVQALTSLANPVVLAARIANGVQSGQSVAEIARDIRPALQGVQSAARRVARTAGLWIAHEAELHTYEQLGDMVRGYQVHAVLDHATRPEHRARDGRKYYREPKAGQDGFDEMPRPPRESPKDGSTWSWNCRCFLSPILDVA